MQFQIGGGNDHDDLKNLQKILFGDDGRLDVLRRETFSLTDDKGKTHTETKTTMMPSKKRSSCRSCSRCGFGKCSADYWNCSWSGNRRNRRFYFRT